MSYGRRPEVGLFCQRTIWEMDFSEKGHLGNGTFLEWERPFQKRTFGKGAFSEKDLKGRGP